MIISDTGYKLELQTSKMSNKEIKTSSNFYFTKKFNLKRIPNGYRSLVLCTGVYQGTQNDFYYVLDQSRKTSDSGLRSDLQNALACSKDSLLQTIYLDDQLRNTTNILSALINVVNRPNGFTTSWNFLRSNWDVIYAG